MPGSIQQSFLRWPNTMPPRYVCKFRMMLYRYLGAMDTQKIFRLKNFIATANYARLVREHLKFRRSLLQGKSLKISSSHLTPLSLRITFYCKINWKKRGDGGEFSVSSKSRGWCEVRFNLR